MEKINQLLEHSKKLKRLGGLTKHPQYKDLVTLTSYLPEDCSVSRRLWHINALSDKIPKCSFCNTKDAAWNKSKGGSYRQYCSNACATSDPNRLTKIQNTNIEKYGCITPFGNSDVQEKTKKTVRSKHGVDNVSQIPEVKQKKQNTSLHNYNVIHPSQDSDVRRRISNTNLEKYGHTNYLASEVGRQHTQASMMERRGTRWANQQRDVIDSLNDKKWLIGQHHTEKKSLVQIGLELGVLGDTVSKYMKIHDIEVKHFYQSTGERELNEWIESLGVSTITNSRNIINGELDIFIPSHNIAIEYNGLYWHCEINGKTANYHLTKTEECEAKGIRLISLFEDEWINQQQQCKDTIAHLLGKSCKGVFARKTSIREISWKTAKDFLEQYHLLGSGSSGSYRIGAFDGNDALIGVMVFGQQNNEGSSGVELKRFVTDKKNNPGIGSKMFAYAVANKEYSEVVAFVDRRWFTGLVKEFIGFEIVGHVPPSLWWTNGKERKHRRFTDKKKLIKEFGFHKTMSKRNMLQELRYYRIWDSGKLKLKWVDSC